MRITMDVLETETPLSHADVIRGVRLMCTLQQARAKCRLT